MEYVIKILETQKKDLRKLYDEEYDECVKTEYIKQHRELNKAISKLRS